MLPTAETPRACHMLLTLPSDLEVKAGHVLGES